MNGSSSKGFWVAAAAVAAAAAVMALQELRVRDLRAQVARLEAQLSQMGESAPAAEPTSTASNEQPDQGGTQSAEEKRELLRLRAQVTQLRGEMQQASQWAAANTNLQAENMRLKQALSASTGGRLQQFQAFTASGENLTPLPPRSGYIGVVLQADSQNQVIVGGVASNSPAANAQLRTGDVIVRIDGDSVTNIVQVRNAIAMRQPGQTTLLEIVRDGTIQPVYVTPKAPPQELIGR